MRDETARLTDNRQTAALISHNFMRDNNLAFSSTRNLQFYHLQILKFFFLDSGFGKIDINDILFYGKATLNQEDRISWSDTAWQSVWEPEKMDQSQAMFLCVCFTCRSKGHASWLWLVVFDPFFCSCTVVNFQFLDSLLGRFSSLVFEQPELSN